MTAAPAMRLTTADLRALRVRISHPASHSTSPPTGLSGEQSGGLPEQMHFRELSHTPFLAATGAALSPGALTPGALRQAAWTSIEPSSRSGRGLCRGLSSMRTGRLAHRRGSDRLQEIAAALAHARVSTAFV